jgi:sugar lactone lactonase YvrE
MQAQLVLDARDIVGESLVWDDRSNRLVWIDIIGRRVHAFDPDSGDHRIWTMPFRPTSISLREDGDAMLCSERHICRWDWISDPVPLAEVEPDLPMNRLNEGAVGPDGALWLGSMHQNIADDDSPAEIPAATGRLYRYTPEGQLTQVSDDRFGIANTLVWPEPDMLVVGDTLENTLYRYGIGADAKLGPREVFAAGLGRGLPDGSSTDALGRVRRLSRHRRRARRIRRSALFVAHELHLRRKGSRYPLRDIGQIHDERGASRGETFRRRTLCSPARSSWSSREQVRSRPIARMEAPGVRWVKLAPSA